MDELTKLMNEININEISSKKTEKIKKETINETELYQKYKSTYSAAFADLGGHALFLWSAFYAMYYFKDSYMTIFTIPFTTFMLLRTFVMFHDCQHGSYTPSPIVNNILSHILGVVVLTSPNWILDHHTHHLTNGNIENKYNYKFNELLYLNLNQYKKFDTKHKNIFRFFHRPIVFFTFFPFLYFFIIQRFIYITKKWSYKDKLNSSMLLIVLNHLINNFGLAIYGYYANKYGILYHCFLSLYLNFILGFFFFFCQHTYNPSYVVGKEEWNQKDSGIRGSSFIQILWYLKYFTMGIEYHHIHHMNAKIPGYHLQNYHEEVVKKSHLFDPVIKVSLWDCYQNLSLVLYDEDAKKYIRMDELEEDEEDQIT